MPIIRLLTDSNFTPEQRQIIELVFKNTLRNLNLVDRNDPICEIVAQRIIKIAEGGITNAVAITQMATRDLDVPNK